MVCGDAFARLDQTMDVVREKEFRHLPGDRCLLTCTRSRGGYRDSPIDRVVILKTHLNDPDRHFYLCGPGPFM